MKIFGYKGLIRSKTGIYIGGGKDATAYELQIHRLGLRYTHLTGGAYFGPTIFHNPRRRFSATIYSKDQA